MAQQYRTSFTVTGSRTDPEAQGLTLLASSKDIVTGWALERLIDPVEDEASKSWADERGWKFQVDEGVLIGGEAGYCRLTLDHPDSSIATVAWRADFRLSTAGDSLRVEVEAGPSGEGLDSLGQRGFAGRPNALQTILTDYYCGVEERPLFHQAKFVQLHEGESFVNEVVLDTLRRMPALVVTQNSLGGSFMSPQTLQSRLLGLANVYSYARDTENAVNASLGERLSCFNGAVRLYRPGCARDDMPRQNPYWTWRQMNFVTYDRGWEDLIAEIVDACLAQARPLEDSRFFERIWERARSERYERLRNRLEEATKQESEFRELFEDAADSTASHLRENRELRKRNDDLERRNAELEDINEQLNVALAYQGGEETSDEPEEVEPSPEFNSVIDAVEYAKQSMGHLRFFSRAVELAKGSLFPQANTLYDAFKALEDCAQERKGGSLGRDVKEWLAERGVDFSPHESATTMGKYGDERSIYDEVERVRKVMQPHIKLGGGSGEANQLRIHLLWDDDEGKWLIGYIGKHLQTATG